MDKDKQINTPIEDPSSSTYYDTYATFDEVDLNIDLTTLTDDELEQLIELYAPLIEESPSDLLTITLNGTTYTHIDETESFTTPSSTAKLTPLAVMKESFPETRSFYQRITPPDSLFLFGNATRRKLVRLAQLHHHTPPITPQTSQYVRFFQYLASSPHVGAYFSLNQYYAASLYAAQHNHELATSLMLYYGWPPDFKSTLMAGTSIHRISTTPTSIIVEIINTHTVQMRLDAACAAIVAARATSQMPLPTDQLVKIGMPVFYSYSGSNISISSDYHTIIQGKILSFIEELTNPLSSATPLFPTIEEPDDFLPPQVVTIPYSSFIFADSISEPQQEQRKEAGRKKTKDILLAALSHLDSNKIYTSAELDISPQVLTTSIKAKYILKVSYGHYKIDFNAIKGGKK